MSSLVWCCLVESRLLSCLVCLSVLPMRISIHKERKRRTIFGFVFGRIFSATGPALRWSQLHRLRLSRCVSCLSLSCPVVVVLPPSLAVCYLALSYLALSYLALPCLALPCLVLSCLALSLSCPCHVLVMSLSCLCRVLSFFSCRILSCLAVPFFVLSCHAIVLACPFL